MSNWKTTIAGALAAGAYAWANAQNMDAKHIAVAVAIAVFGYFTQDAVKVAK